MYTYLHWEVEPVPEKLNVRVPETGGHKSGGNWRCIINRLIRTYQSCIYGQQALNVRVSAISEKYEYSKRASRNIKVIETM